MKEMRLENEPERMNRICLPDATEQGLPLGRGDTPEGSSAISLCFTVSGPRNSKKRFARRPKSARWSTWRNELREIEWQVFMGGTVSDRKQLMENMVTHRKSVQLSESMGDVIMCSLPHHDTSS